MTLVSKEAVTSPNAPAGGTGDSGIRRWPNSRFLMVGSVVLFCSCLATRIPLRSSLLSGWDPVQFALAIHHFDISQDRPQPPGYIVYVALAKVLFRLVHEDNLTLTTLAALFSALSTVLIFLLAHCLYDRRTALLASAVWATCPLVWFHGLVGEIYAAAGFSSLATALSVYLFLRSPSRSMAVCAGGVYGLATGLRPDQLLLLAPLFLFPFWRSTACRRWALYAFCPALAVYAAWYIPTLASVGGYSHYARLVHGQIDDAVRKGNIFFGAPPLAHMWMLTRLVSGLALGLLPLLMVLAILGVLRRPSAQAVRLGRDQALLLVVWATPFLLFYSLIFIGRVSYCIACLPPILLLVSRWGILRVVGPQPEGKRFWFLLISSVVVNAGVFFLIPRVPEPRVPAKSYRLSQLVPEALNHSILSCQYDQIRFDQSVKRRYFEQIRKLLLGGGSALLLLQLGPPDSLNARILQYYFPNVPLYTALGASEPISGFRRAPSIQRAGTPNKALPPGGGAGGERSPTLVVATDRVLLLHSKSLYYEVSARGGAAGEIATEDRGGNRSDIYQVYVLRLTPTSSVEVTSGRQTVSIVERP